MQYLFMYRSLTYAQQSAKQLERAGITGTVTKMPRSAGSRGCAYGVLVSPKNHRRAEETLAASGLSPEKVYIRAADGTVKEAPGDLS